MRHSHLTPTSHFEGLVIDGRYRLLEEIGRGTIGRVYRAEQLRVQREVAVKILRRNFLVDDRMTARFEREAQAVAKLDHPNCLTLHDFGYDEELESLYMVTELFHGGTLRTCLSDLGEHARMQVGFYIADALKHAHAAGVVHRDLKPENVLVALDIDGKVDVKVVDFGLARVFQRGETSGEHRRLTMSGEIYGSPRYLSPEQCKGKLDITAAADVYAFGVMMYELFEGHVPFAGTTVPMVLTAHVSDDPPKMTSFPLVDIEQLIYELLQKEPDQRPTAHEARDVFARNVDLSVSGIFDRAEHGLNEATLGSDAFDDPPPPTEPVESEVIAEAPVATEPAPFRPAVAPPEPDDGLAALLTTREARIGMAVGAAVTIALVLVMMLVWTAIT